MAGRMLAAMPASHLLASLLALGAGPAAAAPGVVQNIAGCRTNTLQANDDGSTDSVPLGSRATSSTASSSRLYVNNNGNVTFDRRSGQYTPFDFREAGALIIAPFFADVDTRGVGSGQVTYGNRRSAAGRVLRHLGVNVGYYSGAPTSSTSSSC